MEFEGMIAQSVPLRGYGGDVIEAYLAYPLGRTGIGGVVVIHHMPGYDRATKEIVRRLAAEGFACICPHLHHRFNPEDPADAAAKAWEAGGNPDDQVVGDVAAAVAFLRDHPITNGKVGVIGFCSGGRQAFLVGCRIPIDAAVDCYGGFVARRPPESIKLKSQPVLSEAPSLGCPLLGLFGKEDQFPSPEEVREIEEELKRLGKDFEFHSYDGAGHAFFNVDRDSYRVQAALDGWAKIKGFFVRHLT
jgi:carboxymethylenebutenolidase